MKQRWNLEEMLILRKHYKNEAKMLSELADIGSFRKRKAILAQLNKMGLYTRKRLISKDKVIVEKIGNSSLVYDGEVWDITGCNT